MRQGISHEMHPAALPGGRQNLGHCRLDALMRVADHQLDPAQPSAGQFAQELGPEGFRLGGADVQTQHLMAAIAVDTYGNDGGQRDYMIVLAHFYVSRVDPRIWPVTFQGPVQKALHFLVDLTAQSTDLALGNAIHPHRLHQIIDRAGRNALHTGLLNDRLQGLHRHPARLQKTRKVAALAQLRDAQLQRARTHVPIALAVAVALRQPFGVFSP